MSYICQICGKKSVVGSSQKHKRGVAGKRWIDRVTPTPRLFKPNLQRVTLRIRGEERQMRICAKCLKRIKKFGAVRNYKSISVV
ncbi:MAG: 50S ribosomal protein L28 [Candidatus Woesebacteria bacterium GW2011_GWB1_39_12]|uniref:Large ribosomal subunit protein bL28 n=2 Tax=Candidatus Woeseibacteriota TaxID=1752722 RepID=A0A0G0QAB8_9BACT|nr:MAG: 50S ribosomal protein L28 [Candidatus Woesebacteria bacterium GW2011_GWA1_39_12]KKR00806.1 MAG: 50S ribosomal protein L28 [Candidatus Woesebacteria bacterium GW2011_GWB1_39_12]